MCCKPTNLFVLKHQHARSLLFVCFETSACTFIAVAGAAVAMAQIVPLEE